MGVISTTCPHCGERVGMPTFGSILDSHPRLSRMEDSIAEFSTAALCPSCNRPISARIGFTRNPHARDYNAMQLQVAAFDKSFNTPETYGYRVLDIWPKRAEPEVPRHLPSGIQSKLLEAEECFINGHINTGAAGLYRSLIDLTTKMQLADASLGTKGALQARLDRLSEAHVIPKAVADWGHEVRAVGNEALHDEMTVERADAEMVRSFALTYLRYAFELPGDIAERRAMALKSDTEAAVVEPVTA